MSVCGGVVSDLGDQPERSRRILLCNVESVKDDHQYEDRREEREGNVGRGRHRTEEQPDAPRGESLEDERREKGGKLLDGRLCRPREKNDHE